MARFQNRYDSLIGHGPVLVLGGSGRLGRMMQLLRPTDGVDWHFQSRRPAPWANLIWDGTPSDHALAKYLERHRPRAVLNLIGLTAAPDAAAFRQVNVDIPAHLLALAQRYNVPHLALVSSAAVYGTQPDRIDTSETAPLHPVSSYGRSKALMERMAQTHRNAGPDISILRIGNVAGADTLLSLAEQGSLALDLLADDTTPVRSYIGPRDLAKTLSILMNTPARKGAHVLNIAHPQPVTIGDLLSAYRTKTNAALMWAKRRAPASTIPKVVLNTKALERLIPSNRYARPAVAFANQVTELRHELAHQ